MTGRLQKDTDTLLGELRSLYGRSGYSRYRMNKFEEYDLYAHNKEFLVSDSVITFTDGTGKLMALKPDVTLSIVKNTADDDRSLRKLYYNENVYRIAKGGRSFKEIMQVGLECIGRVDAYSVFEVLRLAGESLDLIDGDNVLCLSHLGLLSEAMDSIGVPDGRKEEVLSLIGEKNRHELTSLFDRLGIEREKAEAFLALVSVGGDPAVVSEKTASFASLVGEKTLSGFLSVCRALKGKKVTVDFSTVGDIRYYNGFVFKGFVEGIPTSVLSGGEYGALMRKMGRKSDAVGFAVYLDTVERYSALPEKTDADVLLVYDEKTELSAVESAVRLLSVGDKRVLAVPQIPDGIRYSECKRLTKEGILDA